MPRKELARRIDKLKKERGAVILAHNYQPPEIQDIADHLGDSLDLSRLAASLDEEVIIFCGVHFMAETAAMLAPGKKVILPAPDAGCPMAEMLDPEELGALQAKYPDAVTVMYVNSTAEVKALTDICCTSANVLQVIESIPPDKEIIFGPDRYLGAWAAKITGRSFHLCEGYCPSHQRILPEEIRVLRKSHPDAEVLVHPEVNPRIAAEADFLLGTGGMIRHARESACRTFIIGTEVGMTYRLSKLYPDKEFIPASPSAICPNMKKISLEKLSASLETLEPVITVPEATAKAARKSIEAMIKIG